MHSVEANRSASATVRSDPSISYDQPWKRHEKTRAEPLGRSSTVAPRCSTRVVHRSSDAVVTAGDDHRDTGDPGGDEVSGMFDLARCDHGDRSLCDRSDLTAVSVRVGVHLDRQHGGRRLGRVESALDDRPDRVGDRQLRLA